VNDTLLIIFIKSEKKGLVMKIFSLFVFDTIVDKKYETIFSYNKDFLTFEKRVNNSSSKKV
jgi:hypothetical protein